MGDRALSYSYIQAPFIPQSQFNIESVLIFLFKVLDKVSNLARVLDVRCNNTVTHQQVSNFESSLCCNN